MKFTAKWLARELQRGVQERGGASCWVEYGSSRYRGESHETLHERERLLGRMNEQRARCAWLGQYVLHFALVKYRIAFTSKEERFVRVDWLFFRKPVLI